MLGAKVPILVHRASLSVMEGYLGRGTLGVGQEGMNMGKIMARLVPPFGDKHWSFQMVNINTADVLRIRSAFAIDVVKAAKPFLQGNSGSWVMVEFWTNDKILICEAACTLFSLFGLELCEGNFTREELGLV